MNLIASIALSIGLVQAQTTAPTPFVYANVVDVHAIAAAFNLPYPPNASDFIQAFACDYEPGTVLVVAIDYSESGVSKTAVHTVTATLNGAIVVVLVDKAAETRVFQVIVNSRVMWRNKALKGQSR